MRNKVTREIWEIARNLIEAPAYVNSLKKRLENGDAPHMETLLFHYAYGRPCSKEETPPSALTTNNYLQLIQVIQQKGVNSKLEKSLFYEAEPSLPVAKMATVLRMGISLNRKIPSHA